MTKHESNSSNSPSPVRSVKQKIQGDQYILSIIDLNVPMLEQQDIRINQIRVEDVVPIYQDYKVPKKFRKCSIFGIKRFLKDAIANNKPSIFSSQDGPRRFIDVFIAALFESKTYLSMRQVMFHNLGFTQNDKAQCKNFHIEYHKYQENLNIKMLNQNQEKVVTASQTTTAERPASSSNSNTMKGIDSRFNSSFCQFQSQQTSGPGDDLNNLDSQEEIQQIIQQEQDDHADQDNKTVRQQQFPLRANQTSDSFNRNLQNLNTQKRVSPNLKSLVRRASAGHDISGKREIYSHHHSKKSSLGMNQVESPNLSTARNTDFKFYEQPVKFFSDNLHIQKKRPQKNNSPVNKKKGSIIGSSSSSSSPKRSTLSRISMPTASFAQNSNDQRAFHQNNFMMTKNSSTAQPDNYFPHHQRNLSTPNNKSPVFGNSKFNPRQLMAKSNSPSPLPPAQIDGLNSTVSSGFRLQVCKTPGYPNSRKPFTPTTQTKRKQKIMRLNTMSNFNPSKKNDIDQNIKYTKDHYVSTAVANYNREEMIQGQEQQMIAPQTAEINAQNKNGVKFANYFMKTIIQKRKLQTANSQEIDNNFFITNQKTPNYQHKIEQSLDLTNYQKSSIAQNRKKPDIRLKSPKSMKKKNKHHNQSVQSNIQTNQMSQFELKSQEKKVQRQFTSVDRRINPQDCDSYDSFYDSTNFRTTFQNDQDNEQQLQQEPSDTFSDGQQSLQNNTNKQSSQSGKESSQNSPLSRNQSQSIYLSDSLQGSSSNDEEQEDEEEGEDESVMRNKKKILDEKKKIIELEENYKMHFRRNEKGSQQEEVSQEEQQQQQTEQQEKQQEQDDDADESEYEQYDDEDEDEEDDDDDEEDQQDLESEECDNDQQQQDGNDQQKQKNSSQQTNPLAKPKKLFSIKPKVNFADRMKQMSIKNSQIQQNQNLKDDTSEIENSMQTCQYSSSSGNSDQMTSQDQHYLNFGNKKNQKKRKDSSSSPMAHNNSQFQVIQQQDYLQNSQTPSHTRAIDDNKTLSIKSYLDKQKNINFLSSHQIVTSIEGTQRDINAYQQLKELSRLEQTRESSSKYGKQDSEYSEPESDSDDSIQNSFKIEVITTPPNGRTLAKKSLQQKKALKAPIKAKKEIMTDTLNDRQQQDNDDDDKKISISHYLRNPQLHYAMSDSDTFARDSSDSFNQKGPLNVMTGNMPPYQIGMNVKTNYGYSTKETTGDYFLGNDLKKQQQKDYDESGNFEQIGQVNTATIRCISYLGSGGEGRVLLGEITAMKQPVALKQFHVAKKSQKRKNLYNTIKQQISMVKALNHPNIITYYGLHKSPNIYDHTMVDYNILMQFMPGGNLQQLIQQYPKGVQISRVRSIVKQILQGLLYLHQNNIIHRDLKPQNILLNADKTVIKIGDFGISTNIQELDNSMKKRTCAGTPWYMAPEIILSDPYSFGVDIWSLGCCCFELVSGTKPYGNYKGLQAMFQMVQKNTPLEESSPEIQDIFYDKKNRKLLDFLQKCWRFYRQSRPTAKQLIQHPFLKEQIGNQKNVKFKTKFARNGSQKKIIDSKSGSGSSSVKTTIGNDGMKKNNSRSKIKKVDKIINGNKGVKKNQAGSLRKKGGQAQQIGSRIPKNKKMNKMKQN